VAQSLADDGVNFMLLPGDPSVAIPAGKVAQSHKIPMMSILASLPTQRQAVGPYFFVGASSDNIVAASLAKFARDKHVATVYTITGPDTAYTQNYPRYFAEAFEKMGGKLAGTDTYKSGTTDFSSQIAKIRSLNPAPDIIQTAMYEPELPAFIKQLRAAGVTIPLYTSDASDTPAVQGLGQLVDGMHFATLGFPTPGSKLEKFYTLYKAKYGHEPPNVLPAIGYESMKIIAYAVAKAGTADPQAVVDAINGITDFQGILGKTSYQGTKATEGFPVRPIAMQHWAPVTPGSSKMERVFDALVNVSPDQVPAG
jgi:branched-chain amino acid transport system substrate-binding protein